MVYTAISYYMGDGSLDKLLGYTTPRAAYHLRKTGRWEVQVAMVAG